MSRSIQPQTAKGSQNRVFVTDQEGKAILEELLIQAKITNIYLALMTDHEIKSKEIKARD